MIYIAYYVFYFFQIFHHRDYKKEYDRLREEKKVKDKKAEEDKYKAITVKDVMGKEVPMSSISMIDDVADGRELTDLYLKHPGNISSSDDEGHEDSPDCDDEMPAGRPENDCKLNADFEKKKKHEIQKQNRH